MKETFTVEITPKGSKDAFPAIWYCGKSHERFVVKHLTTAKDVYEVVKGKNKGRYIIKQDCRII